MRAAEAVDFRRDIEPIFVKRCSECHGPDKQKSNLRLDHKAEAFRGGKSGKPAIVAGNSASSPIVERVTSKDPDELMPPKGEPLTDGQIRSLKSWIDQGADWPEEKAHWAFVKPVRPSVPQSGSGWARNEIDRFIHARLSKEGLSPAPEADRSTLIRRVSLDITGLPPTPDEVDAFLQDKNQDAYERLVERLLASPHCGEHLARGWLDLARYADSNGYQVDLTRSMWPYREWVIKAFNQNMPFDQFTIEQLAGDLLPNATLDQKIATGFSRNTKTNDEGGGDDEEYRTKAVKDRVATTATTWLGLTMNCAECHSHKYDPISQEEYYRFYAFFNTTADRGNGNSPSMEVPAPPVQPQLDYYHSQIARVQSELDVVGKKLPAEQKEWERKMAGKAKIWTPVQVKSAISTGGATFTNLPDGSLLATGVNSMYDTYLIETGTSLSSVAAVLLEVLPDPSLPKNGPGRWRQTGNFILDELGMTLTPSGAAGPGPQTVFFGNATADWEQEYYRAEHAVDRNPKTGWAIGPKFGERHFLIAELREPVDLAPGARLSFRFDSYHGNNHTIGRLRLSVTSEKDPALLWPLPADVASVLTASPVRRTAEQRQLVAAHHRTRVPEVRRLERELVRLQEREKELVERKYSTLVLRERDEPRKTRVQVRGNFLDLGKEVTPGVPEVLSPLPADQPPNRLALARWLVSPENPLTARVTVNRLWERIFGTGLVKTSEDFGKQGEAPSHPELLDWLAREFVSPVTSGKSVLAHAWDIKHIVRLIVTSATYRQSAATDAERLDKDPYNRLLAHGPRFRMDPEMIRDQALLVSGLLNLEIGGPSVYPPQVANLWKELGFLRPEIGMDEWPTSDGPELYRRGLYTFWRRVCTYPTFATFDAPSREVCTSRRPRTDTPLQALAALNDPVFLEAARVLGQRVMQHGGSDMNQQIDYAFRLCLARRPIKAERERLKALYRQQLKSFERDVKSAETLVGHGAADRPERLDIRRLAAWTMIGNVLLNLDEALTKG